MHEYGDLATPGLPFRRLLPVTAGAVIGYHPAMNDRRSVLFVCLGNICRSQTAEGVMHELVDTRGLDEIVEIDSAGTGDYHVGEQADPRMRRAAAHRGYHLDGRARQIDPEDFDHFDLIVAMDRENLHDLHLLADRERPAGRERVRLLSEFLPPSAPVDVPDPYYGGAGGFERVLDLIEEACPAILDHLLD